MHAVGAFVMGGNSEHPLVCFGLGSSVVALVEWLHSHTISINPPPEMPCWAKSLTLHSTHLIILKINKVLILEHFSDRFSNQHFCDHRRTSMTEASYAAWWVWSSWPMLCSLNPRQCHLFIHASLHCWDKSDWCTLWFWNLDSLFFLFMIITINISFCSCWHAKNVFIYDTYQARVIRFSQCSDASCCLCGRANNSQASTYKLDLYEICKNQHYYSHALF